MPLGLHMWSVLRSYINTIWIAGTIMRENGVEVADTIGVRTRLNAHSRAKARISGRLPMYLVERRAPPGSHFSAPWAVDLAWARLGTCVEVRVGETVLYGAPTQHVVCSCVTRSPLPSMCRCVTSAPTLNSEQLAGEGQS